MTIGVIGTGNMGSILIEALLEGGAAEPKDLIITNRTLDKASQLQNNHPGIIVVQNPEEVVAKATIVFICIKPLDIKPLLDRIKDDLTQEHIIISITSPITVEQIETAIPAKAVRMIPSITNRALGGSTLFTFGKRVSEKEKEKLLEMATSFSTPVEIDESITRIASDLSSCGPAFMSFLLEQMIEASVQETNITRETATILVTDMMIGMGQLLTKNIYSLETLRKKVHVKGGVTGEGLKVLEEEIGEMFHHVFQKTYAKFLEDHVFIDQQFNDTHSGY